MYWAKTAMLSAAAALVRTAECSAGSENRLVSAATSTTPPVVMAPSHSRTYRSFSPARVAISAEVDGGISRIASKRPVRWPTDAMRHRAPSLSTVMKRPAKASAFAGLNALESCDADMAAFLSQLEACAPLGDGGTPPS